MRKNLTSFYILRRLAELEVSAFDEDEFRRILGLDPGRAYKVLHRLAARGVLRRIRQGRYVVVGMGPAEVLGQPLFLATRLVEPSYVSFWSAIHLYGWTEQAPRVVFVATTRRSGSRRVDSYDVRLVRIASRRFFGYATARQGSFEFPAAEPEKALVDSLYLPDLAGGIGLVSEALREAKDTVDLGRLEAYAAAMGIRSLCSRLGYLLEGLGVESEALRAGSSRVYVPLDPAGPRRGRFIRGWKVIDNLGAGGA